MRTRILVTSLLLTSTLMFAQSPETKQQFQQKCSICHGADGRAATAMAKTLGAPDLTSEKVRKAPDAELRTVIENGRGKMAPYGKVLGAKGLDDMVKYVRSLKK